MVWCSKKESEKLGGNKKFENAKRENNFEFEKLGRRNSVIWNQKDSNTVKFDPNHTNLNKPIPSYSTNIISLNDSADICAIENIFSSPVHLVHIPFTVHAPRIFTYGIESDPRSPLHDSLAESVTHKGNHMPRNNPPNPVPNIPSNPDSDPIFQNLLYWIHLTQPTVSIIKEDEVQKIIIINAGVEHASITIFISAQSL